jgi:hypothetical protein
MNFNLSGLFASNFIITIGITLLLAGVIVYYCNTRFVTLERNLNRQNQVLADFISNVQTQLQYSGGGGMHVQVPSRPSVNELATNEAINAVEELNIDQSVYSSHLNTNDKIEVSDNSDTESDSDSDSDSNSHSDSESDNDDNNNNRNTHIVDYVANLNKQNNGELSHHELSHGELSHRELSLDNLNLIENIIGSMPALSEFNNTNDSSIKVISMMSSNEISLDDISHLVSLKQEQNIHEITDITDNVEEVTDNIKDLEESSSDDDDDDSDEEENDTESLISNKKDAFEILNISPDQQTNTDSSKMSVAALREIIIDRKLASKSDAKKMKKNALLEVLNK